MVGYGLLKGAEVICSRECWVQRAFRVRLWIFDGGGLRKVEFREDEKIDETLRRCRLECGCDLE